MWSRLKSVNVSCDCQLFASGWWFSAGTTVSITNKTNRHNIAEILLKVALNIITPNPLPYAEHEKDRCYFG
jgi:hypothetical protein